MKNKLLVSVLTLFIGLGIATSASALSFDFHGVMWQTFGTTDNSGVVQSKIKSGSTNYFGYSNDSGTQYLNMAGAATDRFQFMNKDGDKTSVEFGLTKARLRFEGVTDDARAKFVYGFMLEVGTDNWGNADMDLSGDGVNQETRFAYAQLQMPGMDKNHYIRAGLQPTKINHWVWTETAAGLTYHLKTSDYNLMTGWYRGDDDKFSNASDDDYFILKVNNKINSNLALGLFGIYVAAGEKDTDSYTATNANLLGSVYVSAADESYDDNTYYLGLTGKMTGSFFGNFDLIYQGGEIEFNDSTTADLDHDAWLGNLTVGYKFNDKFKLYANTLYVSGDDDYTDNDAENFNSIDVDVKVGIIFTKDSLLGECDTFITDSPYIMDRGFINYSLTGEYQFQFRP